MDADAVVQLAEQVNSELKLVGSELPFKYHMHELCISVFMSVLGGEGGRGSGEVSLTDC